MKNLDLFIKDYKYYIFYFALFSLIPLWNLPHTIAARYICEALLLLLIISFSLDWKPVISKSKLLILFIIYLFIQLLFFSTDLKSGFSGFKSEWMHFILFSIAGAGAGLVIPKRKFDDFMLYLGAAFATPLIIHLGLSIYRGFDIRAMPWGYCGINEIHGDLGYTALQAAIFLLVYFLCEAKTLVKKLLTSILLLACIISPLIAQSRGGTLFVIVSITFIALSFYLMKRQLRSFGFKEIIIVVCIVISTGALVRFGASASPDRWSGAILRALTGFQGNPSLIFCNGLSSLRDSIQADGIQITPEKELGLKSIEAGDGIRVMAARMGLLMALENPMGINGSKQAYETAIIKFCGKEPAIYIAHVHNAWIDTSLAIGIPGALLLLIVMLNYGAQGFRLRMYGNQINPFAFALFISAFVWILRGVLDSTLRDQMLEMQAFTFALLLALAIKYDAALSTNK